MGPAPVRNGRSAYNAVINQTEDEKILSILVRKRSDETFGMLTVSNVTASLRVKAPVSDLRSFFGALRCARWAV
jgi:hypothetical protein